jgi:hypothetical protein
MTCEIKLPAGLYLLTGSIELTGTCRIVGTAPQFDPWAGVRDEWWWRLDD